MNSKDYMPLLILGAAAVAIFLFKDKIAAAVSDFGGGGGEYVGGGYAETPIAAAPITAAKTPTTYETTQGIIMKNIPASAVLTPTKAQQVAWNVQSKYVAQSKAIKADIARVAAHPGVAIPNISVIKMKPGNVQEILMTKLLLTRGKR